MPTYAELPIIGRTPDLKVGDYSYLLTPGSVHARLSSKCNLDCSFCERESWAKGDKTPEKDMLPEVWDAIRDKYLPFVRGAELCGLGEPTLAKLFPQAARDVVAAGKQLYFPTNGYFLGDKHVLESVGDTPRVSVSLDASDADSYKRVRGGDWERVKASVAAFRAAKPGATLHSQFTAGEYNIDCLPDFMRVCGEWGITEAIMRFVQCHTVAREDVSLRFHRARTERAIESAQAIAAQNGVAFSAERREYSDVQPEFVGGATLAGVLSPAVDPLSRLRRYLDFVPFGGGGGANCPGGSCHTVDTWVTLASGGSKRLGDLRAGEVLAGVDGRGKYCEGTVSLARIFRARRCLEVRVSNCPVPLVCTPEHPFFLPGVGNRLAGQLRPGDALHSPSGRTRVVSVRSAAELRDVVLLSLTGGHTYLAASVYSHNAGNIQVFGANKSESIANVNAEGGATLVDLFGAGFSRHSGNTVDFPVAPGGNTPLLASDASLVAAWDGTLWPCFSERKVGSVLTDTFADVITNQRYQAFLQNRSHNVMDEKWCRNCPRAY